MKSIIIILNNLNNFENFSIFHAYKIEKFLTNKFILTEKRNEN